MCFGRETCRRRISLQPNQPKVDGRKYFAVGDRGIRAAFGLGIRAVERATHDYEETLAAAYPCGNRPSDSQYGTGSSEKLLRVVSNEDGVSIGESSVQSVDRLGLNTVEETLPGKTSETRSAIISDIVISRSNGGTMLRRALLDVSSGVNLMSDDVRHALGIQVARYNGPAIQVMDKSGLIPIGLVEADWKFLNQAKIYRTFFLVIKTPYFDALLGRPLIEEYQLYNSDPGLAAQVNQPNLASLQVSRLLLDLKGR